MPSILHLHPDDNVAVALKPLAAGAPLALAGRPGAAAAEPIPAGHKVALAAIPRGGLIVKYGQPIGSAARPIQPGAWVHTHNVTLDEYDRDHAPASRVPPPPQPIRDRTFLGYRRADGRAGTRNYVAVISVVNCSATVSKAIARRFDQTALRPYPNVDGVIAITHGEGCGIKFNGPKHVTLNRLLGGMARHPNIGACLLVGLGCEQVAIPHLIETCQLAADPSGAGPPPTLSIQACGGTARTIEQGVRLVAELLPRANDVRRTPIPAAELVVGAECGGSDAYSGVTANPALGAAADLIVACGGTVILGETPEIFGAEHLLTRRARSPAVAEKLLERIRWWRWYAATFGDTMDGNPSAGNKEGGLTTIVEKSLGAVAKGGTTALEQVCHYGERVDAKGLVFMDTPGFDPPSVTGMVAGGATVIAFTTGRGSCFGCKPTPSIKIASNTAMFQRLEDDMDLDAGRVLSGLSVPEVGREIFETILAVASGKQTKSEQLGYGDEEFVPWAVGAQL